jgi:2-phospho-L-lactate guanylyltransferase
LNEALGEARDWAIAGGATALLVVHADLPEISGAAIDELVGSAGDAGEEMRPLVALVPDRHGRGTNALLLSPPDAIPFAFGADSREAHRASGMESGAAYLEVVGPLTLDIDTPDDLLLAERRLLERARRG